MTDSNSYCLPYLPYNIDVVINSLGFLTVHGQFVCATNHLDPRIVFSWVRRSGAHQGPTRSELAQFSWAPVGSAIRHATCHLTECSCRNIPGPDFMRQTRHRLKLTALCARVPRVKMAAGHIFRRRQTRKLLMSHHSHTASVGIR